MNINGQFLDFVRTGRSLKAIPMTPTAIAPASPRAEPRAMPCTTRRTTADAIRQHELYLYG